jgi:hypothetical protein
MPSGDDAAIAPLVEQVAPDHRGTLLEMRLAQRVAVPLYAAPAAPVPVLPWGDPTQTAARAFAASNPGTGPYPDLAGETPARESSAALFGERLRGHPVIAGRFVHDYRNDYTIVVMGVRVRRARPRSAGWTG